MTDIQNLSEQVSLGLSELSSSITPHNASGTDATGGTVGSLTEAVMGATAGLVKIAEAIHNLADAVRESNST